MITSSPCATNSSLPLNTISAWRSLERADQFPSLTDSFSLSFLLSIRSPCSPCSLCLRFPPLLTSAHHHTNIASAIFRLLSLCNKSMYYWHIRRNLTHSHCRHKHRFVHPPHLAPSYPVFLSVSSIFVLSPCYPPPLFYLLCIPS